MTEVLWNRALCSLEDVKAYLPGLDPDTPDETADPALTRLINAGSRLIYKYADREFLSRDLTGDYGETTWPAEVRSFDVGLSMLAWEDEDNYRVLDVGDLSDAPSLITTKDSNGTTIETPAASTYVCQPRRRDVDEPITSLWFRPDVTTPATLLPGYVIEVTALYGFPAIPEDVRQAAITQACWPFVKDVDRFSATWRLDTSRVEIPRALCDVARDGIKRWRTRRV